MATQERIIMETLFRVADKDGNDVDFILNSAQTQIDNNLTGRDIIPKARQEGVSTYFLARSTARCLYKRNTRAVVISHDTESTQRMLAKVHYFLENIRGPKAVISRASKNEITFPKTNSVIYIGTAGSRKFGRGDTITDLHCSEYAYWPDPLTLITGLFQAVPKSGCISIESTGNGVGNDYHKRCLRAAAGQSRFMLHFLPWQTFDEYSYELDADIAADIMNNLIEEYEEPECVKNFNLTAGQILWRRDKLEELDYSISDFKQEYPATLDECFQSSGYSIFTKVLYVPTTRWREVSSELHTLDGHPNSNYNYIIGGDVGAGVGRDNSVLEIVCVDTMEQVGEWVSNRIGPDIFAEKAAQMGNLFNKALICMESNNHGIVSLKELSKIYPTHKIHKAYKANRLNLHDESLVNMGVSTTVRSKPLMIGSLRKLLADRFVIHGPITNGELSTFVEKEDGKLEAEDQCMDDRVMALAMMTSGLNKVLMDAGSKIYVPKQDPDPFTLDGIIQNLTNNRAKFPISPQVKTVYEGEQ